MSDTQGGRAFVIRPFGKKASSQGEIIDFDHVQTTLIDPALESTGFTGGTTELFVNQGNIHEDMFREIVTADLVIADVSIHNANAFYELGIRHALRKGHTLIIRADKCNDERVFDLNSERNMSYRLDNPSESVVTLVKVIEETIASDPGDSPVFRLLPGLLEVDPSNVVLVPLVFRERIEQVIQDNRVEQLSRAAALLMLKQSVIGQTWEREGLRCIARAQSSLPDHPEAIASWEYIRGRNPLEAEANQKLATSYQKTGRYIDAEQAARRSLDASISSDWKKAETYALIGSAIKWRWRKELETIDNLAERQVNALHSVLLQQSLDAYALGFEAHRSHYYSGVNTVALSSIQLALADLHPEEWSFICDNDSADPDVTLRNLRTMLDKYIAATDLAIRSSLKNYRRENQGWDDISAADLLLLSCDEPRRVAAAYTRYSSSMTNFTANVIREQISLYELLGVFSENVAAVSGVIEKLESISAR